MTSQITTTNDIKQLGTILSVWAHPDDESYTCAGIMAAAIANGQSTACITATKGEAGIQDESRWPADKLADIRADEMKHALECLGCTNHHWMGYADGGCADVPVEDAVGQLLKFIEQYEPDSILCFGPDGMTGHPDHATVSKWVSQVVEHSERDIAIYHAVYLPETYEEMREADEKFNIFFNIDKPPLVDPEQCDILLRLDDDLLTTKYHALLSMPSQTETMFNALGEQTVYHMINTETFVRAR